MKAPRLVSFVAFLFVLLWSSSFIATKVGLRHLSPLLFVAIRLAGCAFVLALAMLLLRQSWRPLERLRWLHCGIAGALLNAVGLMAPHAGLLIAPAAQIALVQALTPLLTAISGVVLLREKLRGRQWLGLALGLAGVALVVGRAAAESTTRFRGLALAFLGVCGLVAGTLYFRRFCRNVPWLSGATAQFVGAAIVSALGAGWLEVPGADWTADAVAAVAWNTVIVSLGGMGIYFVMLERATAARATANFYLVPGTVAVLAWLLLGEPLSPFAAVGLVVASLGCWMVNTEGSR